MSSRRHVRRKACGTKQGHATIEDARQAPACPGEQ